MVSLAIIIPFEAEAKPTPEALVTYVPLLEYPVFTDPPDVPSCTMRSEAAVAMTIL